MMTASHGYAILPPLWCEDDRGQLLDRMLKKLGFQCEQHANSFEYVVLKHFLLEGYCCPELDDFIPTVSSISGEINPFELPFFPDHEIIWAWFDDDEYGKILALGPKGVPFSPFDYICLRPIAPAGDSIDECFFRSDQRTFSVKTDEDFLPFIDDEDIAASVKDGSIWISLLDSEGADGDRRYLCDVLFRPGVRSQNKVRRIHSISGVLAVISSALEKQGLGRSEINFFVNLGL